MVNIENRGKVVTIICSTIIEKQGRNIMSVVKKDYLWRMPYIEADKNTQKRQLSFRSLA
jgi:hypothetical protein